MLGLNFFDYVVRFFSEASDTGERVRGLVADYLERTAYFLCFECRREEALKHGSLKCGVHDALRDYKAKVSEGILDVCRYPATCQGNVPANAGNVGQDTPRRQGLVPQLNTMFVESILACMTPFPGTGILLTCSCTRVTTPCTKYRHAWME